jgi:archaellum component FlaC
LDKSIGTVDANAEHIQDKLKRVEMSISELSGKSNDLGQTAEAFSKIRTELANELVGVKELLSRLQKMEQELKANQQRLREGQNNGKSQYLAANENGPFYAHKN